MDLTVAIGGALLPNPVGVASGTFGYGSEYEQLMPVDRVGALYTKAVTRTPRQGNGIPRIVETTAGLLNSIGLANVGLDRFRSEKLPALRSYGCPVVVNVAGDTEADYVFVVDALDEEPGVWGYEINVSCPNVKTGGMALGTDPRMVESLTRMVRAATSRPVIVKLTPNVTDITAIAAAAEAGGADAVSCINTVVGMRIDTRTKRPVLPAGTGGLSGPAILPIGVAAVYRVAAAVAIPVIGVGGIREPDDALQYLLAGASAVQIGTANFVVPDTAIRVLDGITAYAEAEGYATIRGFHDLVRPQRRR